MAYAITEEQNNALLDVLTSEDQCVKFLEALNKTGQQHVVNFKVTQNGALTVSALRRPLIIILSFITSTYDRLLLF